MSCTPYFTHGRRSPPRTRPALPELSGISIKKPKIEVKDEHVEQALKNLREQQGTLLPVEDRGISEGDAVEADVLVKNGDEQLVDQKAAQFYARSPVTLFGLKFDNLPTVLADAKSGDTKTTTVTVPDTFQREDLRGKELSVEFKINDIRQLELAVDQLVDRGAAARWHADVDVDDHRIQRMTKRGRDRQ